MWRDICLHNADELLARMGEYQQMMDRLAALVRSKDADGLEQDVSQGPKCAQPD